MLFHKIINARVYVYFFLQFLLSLLCEVKINGLGTIFLMRHFATHKQTNLIARTLFFFAWIRLAQKFFADRDSHPACGDCYVVKVLVEIGCCLLFKKATKFVLACFFNCFFGKIKIRVFSWTQLKMVKPLFDFFCLCLCFVA